ncbi:hypothetical protein [Azospirillum palustre]
MGDTGVIGRLPAGFIASASAGRRVPDDKRFMLKRRTDCPRLAASQPHPPP